MGCNSGKSASAACSQGAVATAVVEEVHSGNESAGQAKTLLGDVRTANEATASKGFHATGSVESPIESSISDVQSSPSGEAKPLNAANLEMVNALRMSGAIKTPGVDKAMSCTDRGDYAPQAIGKAAYVDSPQSIGHSATISAPHMHAHALELLADCLQPGARALDIGCGSGYVAACMARMVGSQGMVIGVDYLQPLVDLATTNIRRTDGDLLDHGQLVVLHGDGWKGCPQDGPFDCIHVGAAAETIPKPLLEQLKPGGRMVIPVGRQSQYFFQIDRKANGEYVQTRLMGVRYVPLVKATVGAASCQESGRASVLKSQVEKQSGDIELQCATEGTLVSAPMPVSSVVPPPEEEKPPVLEHTVGMQSFDIPVQVVKNASIVEHPDTRVAPVVSVKGAPSIQPSDAKCCWCSDLC